MKNYQTYLDGEHWKNIKDRYWKSKLPKKCRICGGNKNLVLHHRTYKHLGKERISIHTHLLCQSCHQKVHFDENGNKTPLTWKALTMRETYLRKLYRAKIKNLRSNPTGRTVEVGHKSLQTYI